MASNSKPITPDTYISPLPEGSPFDFVSCRTIFPYYETSGFSPCTYTLEVFFNDKISLDKKEYILYPNSTHEGEDKGIYVEKLSSGTYQAVYTYVWSELVNITGSKKHTETATYTFVVVPNRYHLKPWTITSAINRTLELCEPLRKGERPRFRLNGMRADGTVITPDNVQEGEEVGQAYKFDKINCPQLSFTKSTLRECLQEIGKVIHGEPRLKPKKDENGWYYEVSYDMYGRGRMSHISKHKPYLVTSSHAIEQFCSSLDSSAENLINTLDKYSGVITEPYRGGSRTVRTESLYVRVTDTNMIIETQYPIYSIDKLEYIADDGTTTDITAYLFETSEYNRLSSYSATFPDSKLYALRYTMGSKNIDGLNFKRENALADFKPFGDYSIVAIIQQESGNSSFSVSAYPTMKFRITYTPIYNTRVAQTKPYYKDVKYPAGLFFNQQSNLVETKYYGENLKGAVARLGNVEKSITYKLYKVYSIPRVGDMYDEDYMISAVAVEWLPTYIKCTIALTKSFNRISQFIGVSSEKRFSEISEKQAVERNVLYREYVVIGDEEKRDGSRIGETFMGSVRALFESSKPIYYPVSCVAAWGRTYKDGEIDAVLLPVVSSAFGNSVSFSWRYEDNYSAGTISQFHSEKINDNTKVEGYFQNAYRYTDNYGKIYYYHFDLRIGGIAGVDPAMIPMLSKTDIPTSSSGIFSTVGQQPYILRKDNREALQVSVQIDFVTNQKDLIIDSALASYCGSVRGISKPFGAKLYVFDEPLDKFVGNIASVIEVDLDTIPSADITVEISDVSSGTFKISGTFPASGKSWAIVTEQKKEPPKMFEDEYGNEEEIEEISGGEVLLAQNMEVTAGGDLTPIYFTPKREVFDKTVWKDRR